jgi:glutaredoxin 3
MMMEEKAHEGGPVVEMQQTTNFATSFATLPQGASLTERLHAAIRSNPIVMFSKSNCPFCFELKATLDKYNVPYNIYVLNKLEDTNYKDALAALKAITNHGTVPQLFIQEQFKGGCDDAKQLEHSGELQPLINEARKILGLKPVANGHPALAPKQFIEKSDYIPRAHTLFQFPDTVNHDIIRLSGVMSCLSCIICIATVYWKPSRWMVSSNSVFLASKQTSPPCFFSPPFLISHANNKKKKIRICIRNLPKRRRRSKI